MISLVKKCTYIFLLFSPLCSIEASALDTELKTMVRTVYPQNVSKSSIHRLIEYIIEGTDYRVYAGKNSPDDARRILSDKPGYQRQNVLMSRIDAILMAIGEKHSVIIDDENKLISVTRNPLYDDH